MRAFVEQQNRERKWAAALLVCVLTFFLAMPLILLMTTPADAVTQAEIDALKNNADDLESQKDDLASQMKAIAADRSQALEQKSLLEQQINVIQEQINNITEQIEKYDGLIAQKEAELVQAEADEAAQYELFCDRVRTMEEDGEVSYWSILFNAADFSDLLDRFVFVNEVMEYDNAVMDKLIAIRQQIITDKAELETAREEQEAARVQQQSAKDELKTQEASVDALVAQISVQQDLVEESIEELEAQAAQLDKEIAAKQKQLEAQLAGAGIKSEAGYLWPLPGYSNLSSLYAGRIDPFTGKPATHTGIDVPAPKNTPIKAAKSGIVITSTYNRRGYGNYVAISHGNGDSTLYAHMTSRAVEEGAIVTQGQVVGYIGTTGRSTGNHLHFEVRVNNIRIDPVTCYSGLTYKGAALN